MASLRQSIETLRIALDRGREPDDDVRNAARVFADACRELNARILRGVEFLDAGMRSEAVYLTQQEPALAEQHRLLATMDPADWNEYARLHVNRDVESAPPLLTRDAQRLAEAARKEESVKPLLRRQRRLALAQAPIRERLQCLWELARVDTDAPPHRDADLAALEAARYAELETETNDALERGDPVALASIQAELALFQWRDRYPGERLKARVHRGIDNLKTDKTRDAYHRLAAALHDAHAAFAFEDAGRFADEWRGLVERSNVPPGDDDTATAAPALAWYDAEVAKIEARHRYERECAELELALDRDESPEDIEKRLRALEAHADDDALPPLPDRLRRAAHKRLDANRLTASRSFRLRLAGVAGAVLVAGALTAFGVYRYLREREIHDWRDQVQAALDGGRDEQALLLLEQIRERAPAAYEHPALQAVRATTDRLIEKENERAARFAETLAALRQAEEASPDTPRPPDPVLLDTLRKTARTDADRLDLREWELRVQTVRNQLRAERVRRFTEAVESQTRTLARLQERFREGEATDAWRQETERARADMARLRREGEDSEIVDAVVDARRELAKLHEETSVLLGLAVEREQVAGQHAEAYAQCIAAGQRGDLAAYRDLVERYIKAFPKEAENEGVDRVPATLTHLASRLAAARSRTEFEALWNPRRAAPEAVAAALKKAEALPTGQRPAGLDAAVRGAKQHLRFLGAPAEFADPDLVKARAALIARLVLPIYNNIRLDPKERGGYSTTNAQAPHAPHVRFVQSLQQKELNLAQQPGGSTFYLDEAVALLEDKFVDPAVKALLAYDLLTLHAWVAAETPKDRAFVQATLRGDAPGQGDLDAIRAATDPVLMSLAALRTALGAYTWTQKDGTKTDLPWYEDNPNVVAHRKAIQQALPGLPMAALSARAATLRARDAAVRSSAPRGFVWQGVLDFSPGGKTFRFAAGAPADDRHVYFAVSEQNTLLALPFSGERTTAPLAPTLFPGQPVLSEIPDDAPPAPQGDAP